MRPGGAAGWLTSEPCARSFHFLVDSEDRILELLQIPSGVTLFTSHTKYTRLSKESPSEDRETETIHHHKTSSQEFFWAMRFVYSLDKKSINFSRWLFLTFFFLSANTEIHKSSQLIPSNDDEIPVLFFPKKNVSFSQENRMRKNCDKFHENFQQKKLASQNEWNSLNFFNSRF